ncbi:MAG: hypothetical protein ACR2M0_07565 [Chloroflexia bacterium]
MDPKEEEREGDPGMGLDPGTEPSPQPPTTQVTLGGTDAGKAEGPNPVIGTPSRPTLTTPPDVIQSAGGARPGEANPARRDVEADGMQVTDTAKLLSDREAAEENISRQERRVQPEAAADLTGTEPYADALADTTIERESQGGPNTSPIGVTNPAGYMDPQRDYISFGTSSSAPGETSARVNAKTEANTKVIQQAESMSGLSSERNEYERQEFGQPKTNEIRDDLTAGGMENLPQAAGAAATVLAAFASLDAAQRAISGLHGIGIRPEDISLVARDLSTETAEVAPAGEAEAQTGDVTAAQSLDDAGGVDAEEGHVGAGRGAIFGGLAGLLVGLAALAIPGIGPIIAAGPLAAAVTGLIAGGITGGLVGALIDAGVPQEHAHTLAGRIEHGDVLVSVRTDQLTHGAVMRVLQANGAEEVH